MLQRFRSVRGSLLHSAGAHDTEELSLGTHFTCLGVFTLFSSRLHGRPDSKTVKLVQPVLGIEFLSDVRFGTICKTLCSAHFEGQENEPKYCEGNTTRTVVRGVQLLRRTLSCMRLVRLFVCLAGTPGSEGSSSKSNERLHNRVKSPISPEELVPTITHDQRQQVPLENQVLLFRSSESSYQSLPHDSLIRQ